MSEDYLDQAHLAHLKSYSYRAQDLSYVGNYILQPWWRFAASFLPRWMAPNLVTLIGFGCIVFNILCLWLFLPDLIGPAPPILYFSFALGLFAYQTMDNCDGKQARATGTSSPLGELFDHVIDSLNCPLGGLIEAASMGLGQSPRAVFFVVIACWPMQLSSWEEFHTGELFLGVINGPDDGLLLAMGVMVLSGIYGPALWQEPVSAVLPTLISSLLPGGMQLQDMFIGMVLVALFVAHAPSCFLHVSRVVGSDGMGKAAVQLGPLVLFTLSSVAWTLSPYSILLQEQLLVEFTLAICFLFGRLSTRIILAHLTKGSFPMGIANLVPLIVGATLVNLPFLGIHILSPALERIYLHLVLIIGAARFFLTAQRIIDRFCEFLGIECLRIPS